MENWNSSEQANQLTELLRRELPDIDAADIHVNSAGALLGAGGCSRKFAYDLRYHISIGTLDLLIRDADADEYASERQADSDPAKLAADLARHVRVALADSEGLRKLAAVRRAVERRLEAISSSMSLRSVMYRPAWLTQPQKLSGRELSVGIDVLDNLLQPFVQFFHGKDSRPILRGIEKEDATQTRRHAASARLKLVGGLLEIETTALVAIEATGLSVDQTVREICQYHRPGDHGNMVVIRGEAGRENLMVLVRDGRVMLAGNDGAFGINDRKIRLRLRIPAILAASYVGRPIGELLDHHLLPSWVEIESVETHSDELKITLRQDTQHVKLRDAFEPWAAFLPAL